MHTAALRKQLRPAPRDRELVRPDFIHPWVPGALAGLAAMLALVVGMFDGPRAIADPASGYLGVLVADAPAGDGALVVALVEDGPGALAGLRTGDVIVRFAGYPVHGAEDFRRLLGARMPGEVVTIHVQRGDGQLVVPARVEEPPPGDEPARS